MDRIKYETFSVSSWLRVSDTLSRNLLSSSLLVCRSANKLSYRTNSTIITRSYNQTDVLKLNIDRLCVICTRWLFWVDSSWLFLSLVLLSCVSSFWTSWVSLSLSECSVCVSVFSLLRHELSSDLSSSASVCKHT